MNVNEQMQELKEFIINFNIDINTDDGLTTEIETAFTQSHAADGWFHGVLALGIPYMGMFLPIIIVFIIFYFQAKTDRDKYSAMIEVSKSVKDPAVIEDLLNSFKEYIATTAAVITNNTSGSGISRPYPKPIPCPKFFWGLHSSPDYT